MSLKKLRNGNYETTYHGRAKLTWVKISSVRGAVCWRDSETGTLEITREGVGMNAMYVLGDWQIGYNAKTGVGVIARGNIFKCMEAGSAYVNKIRAERDSEINVIPADVIGAPD